MKCNVLLNISNYIFHLQYIDKSTIILLYIINYLNQKCIESIIYIILLVY